MNPSKRFLTAALSVVMAAGSVSMPNIAFAEEPDVVPGAYSLVRENEETERPVVYDTEGRPIVNGPTVPAELVKAPAEVMSDDSSDVAQWDTKITYNPVTHTYVAEPYAFKYEDEDYGTDAYNQYGCYAFYIRAGETAYNVGIQIVSTWTTPSPCIDLRLELATRYMDDESFREYVDNGGKLYLYIDVSDQRNVRNMGNLAARSGEVEVQFDPGKTSSVKAPSKIYSLDDELCIEGVNGSIGYIYSFGDENWYNCTSDTLIYNQNEGEIRICSVDENGVPGSFATITPEELGEEFDANVSYSKKTGLYGFDDHTVELPSSIFQDAEYEIKVSNGRDSLFYTTDAASDGRHYIAKNDIMLALAERSVKHGNSNGNVKYEGDQQNFYLTATKNVAAYYDADSYQYFTVPYAVSEHKDGEPYITYDGADISADIKTPENLKQNEENPIVIKWDESEGAIGYILVEEYTTPSGSSDSDIYSTDYPGCKLNRFKNIGSHHTLTVYAVNANGDISEPITGEFDVEGLKSDLIDCPESWKSSPSFDASTGVMTFDAYPVPQELIDLYPDYTDYYSLTTPVMRWLGTSSRNSAAVSTRASLQAKYFTDSPFYGTMEARPFYTSRNIYSAAGFYPVSEDGAEISYYGPKTMLETAAPSNKYELSGFESYIDYDMNYVDYELVNFEEVSGASAYVFKAETKYGIQYSSNELSPEFKFYANDGSIDLSYAYIDADGNLSKFSEPVHITYDPSILVGTSEITSLTVNKDNTVTASWTAAKNASGYMLYVLDFSKNSGRFYVLNGTGTTGTIKGQLEPGWYGATIVPRDKRGRYSNSVYQVDAIDFEFEVKNEVVNKPVTPKISVAAGDGKAVLAWGAVNGADLYRVFSIVNGKAKQLAETKDCSYTATGLTNGQKTGFVVLSRVNGQWSTYTNSDVVYVTPEAPKITKPIVTAEPTYGGAEVSWKPVDGAINYRVYTFVPGGKIRQFGSDTTGTSMTVKGLKGGEKTGIIVLAQYANKKWSKYTDEDIVYVVPKDAVKPYLCVNPKGNGNYYLIWSSVPTSVRYKVMAREKGTDNWELIGATRQRCRITVEMDPNKQYDFLVRGLNAKNKYTPMDADDIVAG